MSTHNMFLWRTEENSPKITGATRNIQNQWWGMCVCVCVGGWVDGWGREWEEGEWQIKKKHFPDLHVPTKNTIFQLLVS